MACEPGRCRHVGRRMGENELALAQQLHNSSLPHGLSVLALSVDHCPAAVEGNVSHPRLKAYHLVAQASTSRTDTAL